MSRSDGILVAKLSGRAKYCVNHKMPEAEAISSLHEYSQRPDLLAEAAGIIIGASEPELADWPQRRAVARLLIAAGADRDLLPRWVAQGRENAQRNSRNSNKVWPEDTDWLLADTLEGLGG